MNGKLRNLKFSSDVKGEKEPNKTGNILIAHIQVFTADALWTLIKEELYVFLRRRMGT
jgi:hypothetical protein